MTLDECAAAIAAEFPGWWWTAGLCDLTGHASLGPDYNGPHRERLMAEFPVAKFDGGFHSDLAPGDGIGRVVEALQNCMAEARTTIAAMREVV